MVLDCDWGLRLWLGYETGIVTTYLRTVFGLFFFLWKKHFVYLNITRSGSHLGLKKLCVQPLLILCNYVYGSVAPGREIGPFCAIFFEKSTSFLQPDRFFLNCSWIILFLWFRWFRWFRLWEDLETHTFYRQPKANTPVLQHALQRMLQSQNKFRLCALKKNKKYLLSQFFQIFIISSNKKVPLESWPGKVRVMARQC